ncbi:MAG TPA: glutamine amidotransferase [Acidobacteriota bacterium]|nr:glutamine amidotransferase [Acidobacteriota bacterium]
MDKQILYLGDTALKEAASYLAGIMSFHGISFDYRPSDARVKSALLDGGYRAVILSDFPSKNFTAAQLDRLAERVRNGMGLLMIGGWESFLGAGGDYTDTALSNVLPVGMQSSDDRINCPQPCLAERKCAHPIVDGLPFEAACPGIGGYNRVTTKPGAIEVLSARRFSVRRESGTYSFTPDDTPDPLLVVGSHGTGRVTAFTSDVAPHWVGGLVDWGKGRVAVCAEGASPIEVGDHYARLFAQMVKWTAQMS